MSEDIPQKMTAKEKAELILRMTKEAKMLERSLHAEAVVVIAMFKDGNQITVQDAGCFPMPPPKFYEILIHAHQQGLMSAIQKRPKKVITN